MNKKLTRKLTLSAVTLGVAALSLTSTTYAWFTTNGSATASNISGSVAASDANMLIKTPTNYNENENNSGVAIWGTTFTKSASLTQAFNYSGTSKSTLSMQPVTWDTSANSSAGGFTKAGTDTDATKIGSFSKTATMNEDILHYEVIFAITDLQQGATKNVSVSFADLVKDSTKSSGTQYLLVDALNGTVTDESKTKAEAGKTIDVSILDVLSLRVESTELTATDLKTTYQIDDTTDNGITFSKTDANYRYKAEVGTLRSSGVVSDDLEGNAIDYYKNVYGSNATSSMTKPDASAQGYADSKYFGADDITLFTVEGGSDAHTVYVKTDFYFYIDGWDNQCFNCVGGLSLGTGSMTFTCANKEGN